MCLSVFTPTATVSVCKFNFLCKGEQDTFPFREFIKQKLIKLIKEVLLVRHWLFELCVLRVFLYIINM